MFSPDFGAFHFGMLPRVVLSRFVTLDFVTQTATV